MAFEEYIYNLFEEYITYCENAGLNDKTIKAYIFDLKQYFDFCRVNKLSVFQKETIIQYPDNLNTVLNYKHRTVVRKLLSIEAFLNYLKNKNMINEIYINKVIVEYKKLVHYTYKDELSNSLEVFNAVLQLIERCKKVSHIVLIYLMITVGIPDRILLKLEIKHVNINDMNITYKDKVYFIKEKNAILYLKKYYNNIKEKQKYLFETNTGTQYKSGFSGMILKRNIIRKLDTKEFVSVATLRNSYQMYGLSNNKMKEDMNKEKFRYMRELSFVKYFEEKFGIKQTQVRKIIEEKYKNTIVSNRKLKNDYEYIKSKLDIFIE